MKRCEPSGKAGDQELDTARNTQLLRGVCGMLRDGLGGEAADFYFERGGALLKLELQTLTARSAPAGQLAWMRDFLRSGQPFLLLSAEGRRTYEAVYACGADALVLVTGLREKPDEARQAAVCALLGAVAAPNGRAVPQPEQQAQPYVLPDLARRLQAPLSVALQAADILKASVRNQAEPESREALSFLEQSLYQELRITENLAQLGTEKNCGEREYLDFHELTRQTVAAAERYVEANGVCLFWRDEAGCPMLGAGRADFWQRIVLNLLSNAVRQCPETGGAVTVSLGHCGEGLLLAVQDNGPGIAPGELPHLFTAFWQGESTARGANGGVGLGLYLVRRFAQALGGEAGAENAVGGGARFTVCLPLAAPEGPQDEQLHASVLPYGDGAAGELAKTEFSVFDQWPAGVK